MGPAKYKCFSAFDATVTFDDASASCRALGASRALVGSLARVESFEELGVVSQAADANSTALQAWLDGREGRDAFEPGVFVGSDSTPLQFTPWAASEPAELGAGIEGCVRASLPALEFAAVACALSLPAYVCQLVEPPPPAPQPPPAPPPGVTTFMGLFVSAPPENIDAPGLEIALAQLYAELNVTARLNLAVTAVRSAEPAARRQLRSFDVGDVATTSAHARAAMGAAMGAWAFGAPTARVVPARRALQAGSIESLVVVRSFQTVQLEPVDLVATILTKTLDEISLALGVTVANVIALPAGCSDPNAPNFDSQATEDDGSCVYAPLPPAPPSPSPSPSFELSEPAPGTTIDAVVGVPERIVFGGSRVADGDTAFWVSHSAVDCVSSEPAALLGGVQTVSGGAASFVVSQTSEASVAAGGLRLCYAYAGEAHKLQALRLRVITVTASSPARAALVVGQAATVTFSGVGISSTPTISDRAKWMRASATSCDETAVIARRTVTAGTATFTATSGGLALRLCYKLGAEPYKLFPAIVADALAVTGPTRTIAIKSVARTVTFAGFALAAGDRAFWVATSAPLSFDCVAAESGALEGVDGLGGVQTLDASLSATFTFAVSASELRLCFAHGDAAWSYYPAISLVSAELTGPAATLAVAGTPEPLVLEGVGIAAGDTAFWASAGGSCAEGPRASLGGRFVVGTANVANFTATERGAFFLCYSFGGLAEVAYSQITLDVRGLTGLVRLTAQAAVSAEPWLVQFEGDVSQSDAAYWVSSTATSCAASPARSQFGGGERAVVLTGTSFTWARGSGGLGFRLCYRFGASEPFRLYLAAAFLVDVFEVTGPLSGIAVQLEPTSFVLGGVGLSAGDDAFWLPPGESTCSSSLAAGSGVFVMGSGGVAEPVTFATVRTGLRLCYRFGGSAGGRPFTFFPRIAVSVIFPSDPFANAVISGLAPSGAALNTPTTVTISGSQLEAAAAKAALVYCRFGALNVTASSVTSNAIVCVAPARAVAEIVEVSVAVDEVDTETGTAREALLVSSDFTFFDMSAVTIESLLPAGLPQGVTGTVLTVRGVGIRDYGNVLVQFGNSPEPVAGRIADASVSELTVFAPYSAPTDPPGAISVEISLNGQAFTTLGTTFQAYTASLASGFPTGAPLGAPKGLTLTGTGFVDLGTINNVDVARCFFKPVTERGVPTGGAELSAVATVVSPSSALCDAPSGTAGLYSAALSLNGGYTRVPLFFSPIYFRLYERTSLAVSSLLPPGGSVAGGTVVTVSGAGFRSYGSGQLCCVFADTPADTCGALATLLGTLGDRLLCAVPAAPANVVAAGNGTTTVAVSLNGGSAASTSATTATFRYHAPPTVTGIQPAQADALGGTLVTITGSRFGALAAAFAELASSEDALALARVRFGSVLADAPVFIDDTTIVVVAPWGTAGAASVSVSLNGQQFVEPNPPVQLEFVGLHAPELLGAKFDLQGTRVILTFDEQETNRGGMAGVEPCAIVLDDATVALIAGDGTEEPLCVWQEDGYTLVAYLTSRTRVAPGSTITLRPNVIRPALSTQGCPSELCATGSATISVDFPCGGDLLQGVVCNKPVAVVTGLTSISSCPNEVLALSASGSSGGGIKQLSYAWRSDPTRSDFAQELNALLEPLDGEGASSISLSGLPAGGAQFVLLLRVTSFLGLESELASYTVLRSGGSEPSLAIDGPAQRVAWPASTTQLLGTAVLAACWRDSSNAVQVNFEWRLDRVVYTASGLAAPADDSNALVLDTPTLSSLLIAPFSLLPGFTYTLSLTAAMSVDPAASATSTVSLRVLSQPLQLRISGGDRRLSVTEEARVDASGSFDPNRRVVFDPETGAALPDTDLAFAWSLSLLRNASTAEAVAFPAGATPNSSVLILPADSLGAGTYILSLLLTKPSSSLSAQASLTLELVLGAVPSIIFEPLTSLKFNPQWDTNSQRVAIATRLDAASAALQASGALKYNYRWRAFVQVAGVFVDAGLDLSDTRGTTTTGGSLPNLAFRSGALTAGALYSFELTVEGGPQEAFGAVAVQMNRPPFAGVLVATPAEGPALVTIFELRAPGWVDDEEDLPLRFAFEFISAPRARPAALADLLALPVLGATLTENELGVARVRVLDVYGATALARTPINVTAPPPLSCEDLVALLEEAEEAVLTGAAAAAKRRLSTLAVAFAEQLQECDPDGDGIVNARRALAQANETDSEAAMPFVNRMLAVSAGAIAGAVSTTTSRRQSGGTLELVLSYPRTLNGAAQLEASTQLDALTQASADGGGLDEGTASSLVEALGSVLEANASRADAEQLNQTNAAAISVATGLARAFLVEGIAGEASREVLNPRVNVSAARTSVDSLANSTRAAPGGAGAFALPLTTLAGQPSDAVDGGVDVLMYSFARNVHGDPTEQPASDSGGDPDATLSELQTGILSLSLRSAALGSSLKISGLPEPIRITIPLTTTGAPPATCHFWNVELQRYDTDGCTTVPTPAGGDPSLLYCDCTHLTDFAGIIVVPKSVEELVDEVEDTRVNTFSAQEAASLVSDIDVQTITENPIIYGLVFGMSAACLLSVLVFCYRDINEERARAARIAAQNAGKVDEQMRAERLAKVLETKVDQLEVFMQDAAAKAAIILQRYTRGRLARKRIGKLLNIGQNASRKIKRGWKWLVRNTWERIRTDHSLLGLWYGDPMEAKRAELAQRFWNLSMLSLVIECMLYSPPNPQTGGPGEPESAQADDSMPIQPINVAVLVIAAAITSACLIPAMIIINAIFAWGYARTSPIGERLAGVLLGGDVAKVDSNLIARAKPGLLEKALAGGTLEDISSRSRSRQKACAGAPGAAAPASVVGKSPAGSPAVWRERVLPLNSKGAQERTAIYPTNVALEAEMAKADEHAPAAAAQEAATPVAKPPPPREERPPVSASEPAAGMSDLEQLQSKQAQLQVLRMLGGSSSEHGDSAQRASAARCGSAAAAASGSVADAQHNRVALPSHENRSQGASFRVAPQVEPPRGESPLPPPAAPPNPTPPSSDAAPPGQAAAEAQTVGAGASASAGGSRSSHDTAAQSESTQPFADPSGRVSGLGQRKPPPPPKQTGGDSAEASAPTKKRGVLGALGKVFTPVSAALRIQHDGMRKRSRDRQARLNVDELEHDLDDTTVLLLRAKFVKYDRDDNGQISVKELGLLMEDLGFDMSMQGLRSLQEELDRTGEGLVSLTELVMWYNKMVQEAILREARRKKGWYKRWARIKKALALPRRVRMLLAWLLMWALFVCLALIAVVYSRVFGARTTRFMLFSWCLAQTQTLSVEEPIIIFLAILLPWLIDGLSSNELTGELLGSAIQTLVNNCMAPIKRCVSSMHALVFRT